jgi:hypothetical protein
LKAMSDVNFEVRGDEVWIGLTPDQIEMLVRACECSAVAMEDKLEDENYMLDIIESDQQKIEDFRAKCGGLRLLLDAILITIGK